MSNMYELELKFKSMSREERDALMKAVAALNLATDINKDPEFLDDNLQELFDKYPLAEEAFGYLKSQRKI